MNQPLLQTAPRSDPAGRVGQLLNGRYFLRQFLGLGAAGTVYAAADRELRDLVVAVKLLYPHLLAKPEMVERFRSEVRIARCLSHPNIVRTHEFGKSPDGAYFIVMEFVPGTSLAEILRGARDHRLPFDSVVSTLFEIASGVAHAHEQSIVHRDLKPQNIIVSEDGRISVCDFGMARQLESDDGLTRTGDSIGTPFYMAPEIFRGEEADEQADVYALGIMAYELASGRRPFEADAFYSLAMKHVDEPLPPLPSELHLPGWFHDFVRQASAKPKEERFASAGAIVSLLERHLGEDVKSKRGLLFTNWQTHERRRVALERRRKRRRYMKLIAIPLFALAMVLSIFLHFNIRQRAAVGVWILKADRYLPYLLTQPLKRFAGIDTDFSEQDLIDATYAQLLELPEGTESVRAVEQRNARIQMLIEAGVNPNVKDEHGTPLILTAVKQLRNDLAEIYISSETLDVNVKDEQGTPLLHLLIVQRLRAAQRLLMMKPNINRYATNAAGETALHCAVKLRDRDALDPFFWQWKDDKHLFGMRTNEGKTALEIAVADTAFPSPQLLFLLKSSDIEAKNPQGQTPLIIAIRHDNCAIIKFLLGRDARLSTQDEAGRHALFYAATDAKPSCLEQIVSFSKREAVAALIDDLPEAVRPRVRELLDDEPAKRARRNTPLPLP